jgi:hypothetical protein
MTPQRSLTPVPIDQIEDYPIGRETRLDGHHFTRWNHNRWLNSSLHLLGDYEVQGMARAMFDLAQNGNPIGTLPANEAELAALLRVPLPVWHAVCNRPVSPMHNWVRCRCGNEVRLMHPVVLEVLQDTIRKVEDRDLSKEERAVAARRKRLVSGLASIGCSNDMVNDHVLIGRMDQWLIDTWKGNRTVQSYISALDHSVKSGWMLKPPNHL